MSQTQHVMTHEQWVAAGGWAPSTQVAATDIVIALIDDNTAEVFWASWAPSSVDPATRINPDVKAVDHR